MKSNRIDLLDLTLGKTYKKCLESGEMNDKQLFVNSYNLLNDAIEEYEALTIENPLIKIGFSKIYNDEMQELKKLEQSLKDRNMI